ncbi:MAG TPA: hypothetical protein VHV56_03825 [Pseudolabrys sp.]|jgi:hypothetical protein|nr:hypothetical protein [Pseudolabrys sp.]
MSEQVKLGLIIAAAIICAAAIREYFSPYHSCLRAYAAIGATNQNQPELVCGRLTGGGR